MLRIENLTIRFGEHEVLAGLDLAVAAGETVGLIGPNGAGKTTLFNAVTGLVAPAGGRVVVDGADVIGRPPDAIARLGVARTFQDVRLFRRLDVRDNARAAAHGAGRSRAEVDRLLAAVGLAGRSDAMPDELPLAQQRRLELARALAAGPKLLLLDEPAGGMTESETDAMAALLRDVAIAGRTCVIIEHKMALIAALCRRVVVLDFGRKIADAAPERVLEAAAVRAAYLGEDGDA